MSRAGCGSWTVRAFFAAALGLSATLGLSTSATAQIEDGQPAVCPAPGEHWSETEKLVWADFVCTGETANFLQDERLKNGTALLTNDFLEAVLLRDPWRSAVPWRGVRIIGAQFADRVDLSNSEVTLELWLEDCKFLKGLNFNQATFHRLVSLDRSIFEGPLFANNATFRSSLFLRTSTFEKLRPTRENRSSASIEFLGAEVLGDLYLSNARLRDQLKANDLSLGGDLVGDDMILWGDVVLDQAKVGGTVQFSGSNFERMVFMRFIKLDGNLLLVNVRQFPFRLDLEGARVDGALQIKSDAAPGEEAQRRLTAALLSLFGAHIGSIDYDRAAWPARLDLRGLEYQVVQDFLDEKSSLTDDYIDWLRRSVPYSPQPYQYAATISQSQGFQQRAEAILIAARDLERRALFAEGFAWHDPLTLGWWQRVITWSWRTVQSWIGYGYDLRLLWVAVGAFIGTGMLILQLTGEARRLKLGTGLLFSFDMMLPIVQLRGQRHDVELAQPANTYFVFHQIMGYVLATLLAVGLTGLVK